MSECEHVWEATSDGSREFYTFVRCEKCGEPLGWDSVIAKLNENAALKQMVLDAHEACHSEYMECPWCSGHVGHNAERHDDDCPWVALLSGGE